MFEFKSRPRHMRTATSLPPLLRMQGAQGFHEQLESRSPDEQQSNGPSELMAENVFDPSCDFLKIKCARSLQSQGLVVEALGMSSPHISPHLFSRRLPRDVKISHGTTDFKEF